MIDFAKLLDLRTVLQPTLIPEREDHFLQWKQDFENAMIPLDIDELLAGTIKMTREPSMHEMTDMERIKARLLYSVLMGCAKSSHKAKVIIAAVTDKNGFAAWQRLNKAYRPPSDDRYTSMYLALMQPRFTTFHLLDQIQECKNFMDTYRLETGEEISGRAKLAALTRAVPPQIRQFLRTCPESVVQSFEQLDRAITNYVLRGEVYDPTGALMSDTLYGGGQRTTQRSAPMEVGCYHTPDRGYVPSDRGYAPNRGYVPWVPNRGYVPWQQPAQRVPAASSAFPPALGERPLRIEGCTSMLSAMVCWPDEEPRV